MADRANRISVTAAGSFEMDEDMYEGEEGTYPTEFQLDAEQFAKALDAVSNPEGTRAERRADILRLVENYYEIASRLLQNARESTRQTSRALQRRSEDEYSQDSMDVDEASKNGQAAITDRELALLVQEVQIWDLLRRLLPLRYPERKIAQTKRREPPKFQTGAELWEEFLQSDTIAQERKEILEVLQTTADESRDGIDEMVHDLQENAERGDIIAYGWLHTRSAIKMQKRVSGWTGTLDPNSSDVSEAHRDSTGANPLATQLDPDVVTRQERKLQPQDEYFERAIWLGCYELLRRGRSLSEIRDWCVERTEVWRAVSMSALPLSRDPEDEQTNLNPLSLLLWRRTCYALARQGGTDSYERAVYGILSGDVKAVSPVCGSWDDHVFVQTNALLRSQFDNFILKRSARDAISAASQLPVFDAIQSHGDAATVSEAWLSSLDTQSGVADEARTPIKSLQAAILSNTLDQYIFNEGLVLGQEANQKKVSPLIPDFNTSKTNIDTERHFPLPDQGGLRILVHAYLLVAKLDELQGEETDADSRRAQENVLAAYISTLRLNDLVELLPLYCSKLEGERAFYTLSRNISTVINHEDRAMLLRIMEKLGMDVADFVVFQPGSLLKEHPEDSDSLTRGNLSILMSETSVRFGRRIQPDFLGEELDELDPVDEQLIQSLEWMLLVDGLWDETFTFGVAIYKRFFKSYNLQAAFALQKRVQCSEIFKMKAGIVIPDKTELSWFNELANGDELVDEDGNPRNLTIAKNFLELESLIRALDTMETIGSTAELQLDPTFQRTADFLPTLGGHIKAVKDFMQPLLDGWLLERVEEDTDLDLIRTLYLPETILGYVSVLHYGGTALSRDFLLEALELAARIAEKDSDVAPVILEAGRMKELFEAFANCSKALAVNSEDKRKGGTGSSKKLREMGWSRDVWSVKR